ncbi:TonB-dependent hemoglobin/transferrin/lactoferrin family receptor [Parvibaculum sp.]|uniref:TonB-dependent hemoglobin/transferrin/lactoferrin family receptor n=1 Tax=Parvibaculum sp. TaxID=2024848 RepID=UPI001B17F7C0|nr:TonB-dependent hemoglobin/transferrin/lactoferrin family receptor [Parvibaculum sp.]MBO6636096.1 TonB-dependent hemoglobin/transferrin/lactoferrin family receptor [Parvibaculum sp.]MBO6677807.1 TonB-dependent hemoglobin/transferrin/lactoferrin family receptor [Parvibaculum sp.]MBO6903558.1 TonB-dependent hemoglobin/transferrin/lactoferrin family receptor [Parvibaculum sp.]
MAMITGRRSLLSLLLATASLAAISTAQAQDTASSEEDAKPRATQLDAVTSTATRNPTPIKDVAGTVSVITAEELERRNAHTMQDIVRYEPGVSVGYAPNRGGSTNFTIRGIGGNRVLVLVDGLNTPDFPGTNIGSPSSYTRDFFDIDSMKSIEIVRGPASALYGSDGLGGIVAYETKDPADYLDGLDKDWYASIKGGYASADESFSESLTGAKRAGNVEMLGLYTRRDGHEIEPNSSATPNPTDWYSNAFLGKLVFNGLWGNSLKFTGEYNERNEDINLLSDLGTSFGTTTLSSQAEDETKRTSFAAAYSQNEPFLLADSAEFKFSYTKIDRNENTVQLRQTGPTQFLRNSDFAFLQDIWAADFQFNLTRNFFGVENQITYGASADYTKTSRPRYRTQTNLTTLVTTTVIGGETFPNKNFPDTETTKLGFFVQDSIEAGRFNFIPALRFDYYHLEPQPDALFANASAGAFAVKEMTETEVSPKLGITFDVSEEYTLFGQYAHGFRAPPYDNANFGFRNSAQFYEIIPNPDLKPETSDGFEAGLRGSFRDGSSFSTTVFYNMYEDFIDTVTLASAPPPGLTTFQYQNLSEVTIYGAEARGEYRFLPEWALKGSLAYAHGEDDTTGAPIDSVDPMKAVLGLAYEGDMWGAELSAIHAWRHDRVATAGNFQAPSYTVVDVTAWYDMSDCFTVNAGIFNIFDEEYYNSQDVTGLAAGNPVIPRYAQPRRNFGVNATLKF